MYLSSEYSRRIYAFSPRYEGQNLPEAYILEYKLDEVSLSNIRRLVVSASIAGGEYLNENVHPHPFIGIF